MDVLMAAIQGELQKHTNKYAGEVIGICMAMFMYCLHMSKMNDALVRQAHVCKINASWKAWLRLKPQQTSHTDLKKTYKSQRYPQTRLRALF